MVKIKKMKNITINLPDSYVDAFESLIDLDIYHSRSEILRNALESFFVKEFDFFYHINKDRFYELKEKQRDLMFFTKLHNKEKKK